MKVISLGLALFIIGSFSVIAQEIAPLWTAYEKEKSAGTTPLLPDFSYAGYHFSEKVIPEATGKRFVVTDFGAIPDDGQYDDEGIQAAIDAAEQNAQGGVVYFPPGRYLIAPDQDRKRFIRISKSNIVLKGSGSGPGGTEIFQDSMRIGSPQFRFEPKEKGSEKLTEVVKDAPRESFWVEVADASTLKVGQDVVLRHQSEAYTRDYFAPLELSTNWTRLFGPKGGMQIREIHTIESIEGNRVKFKNPLHLNVKMIKEYPFALYTYNSIEECGIEDILFTSNWKNYPEDFHHHKDNIHDGGWVAVGMENIKNSWVRNCEFKDWNEVIHIRAGYLISILNVDIKGKKGHTSVHARSGYGVLIKNCNFNGAHHHGPGTGYSAAGTVVTQCTMGSDQIIDSHSGQPYATLFDDIDGGVFYNLGGPLPGLPHHGKYLVFWNFAYRSNRDFHYNFWSVERRRNYTIAAPIFVGFQPNTTVTFENEGLDELRNMQVAPKSLFEAQLAFRLLLNQ